MTTITNNLTATRKCNASVVNKMFENAFFAYRRSEVANSLQADAQCNAIIDCLDMLVKESKHAIRNAIINAYEESVAAQKAEEQRKAEEERKQAEIDYPNDDRMYQLQGEYTRYFDGLHIGFGDDKRRNFKTIESAIRAAKKALKKNDLPKVVRSYKEQCGPRPCDYRTHSFAEDGHEFTYGEEYAYWHVDALRIVNRVTGKVLWES